ncbi:MAG: hypothetical protein KHZ62_00630 [Clostridiales bacterium]|nr:hypothetical protein [Clostridiales bacterium]
MKWFEMGSVDESIFVSTRVEIRRNVSGYFFPSKMDLEQSEKLMKTLEPVFQKISEGSMDSFQLIRMDGASDTIRTIFTEKGFFKQMMRKDLVSGVFLNDDETFFVVINDGDHVRFASEFAGESLEEAYLMASAAEEAADSMLSFAFDEELGYLCENIEEIGTGLLAAVTMDLVALERDGRINDLMALAKKEGLDIQKLDFSTGTPCGSFYEIETGMCFGKREDEMLEILRRFVYQVFTKEKNARGRLVEDEDFCDQVTRAYGTLKYARKISMEETADVICLVREGYQMGILKEPRPRLSLCNLCRSAMPGSLKALTGSGFRGDKIECIRADYIQRQFI